jgi:hypothetical protein
MEILIQTISALSLDFVSALLPLFNLFAVLVNFSRFLTGHFIFDVAAELLDIKLVKLFSRQLPLL